jgi:hypothetical protein
MSFSFTRQLPVPALFALPIASVAIHGPPVRVSRARGYFGFLTALWRLTALSS